MLDRDEQDIRGRRRDQTRRQIIDAAWSLAERDGIGGLSFREVAREVGMQAPSLYTYFGSKDDLFDAMFAQGYLELEAMIEEATPEIAGLKPVEAVERILVHWIRFCQASLARYQLMFTRAIPGWSPSPDAYSIFRRQFQRMAEDLAGIGIDGQEALDMFLAVSAGMAPSNSSVSGVDQLPPPDELVCHRSLVSESTYTRWSSPVPSRSRR